LNTPIEKINVHVRGGYIIPLQIPGENLSLGRGNPFQLLVALSQSGNASGNLYWDDGDSIGMFQLMSFFHSFITLLLFDNLDSIETKTYNYFEFSLTSSVSQQR
jgi:alpha-glucosidase (family GH31 glycosyl hydrolase)